MEDRTKREPITRMHIPDVAMYPVYRLDAWEHNPDSLDNRVQKKDASKAGRIHSINCRAEAITSFGGGNEASRCRPARHPSRRRWKAQARIGILRIYLESCSRCPWNRHARLSCTCRKR